MPTRSPRSRPSGRPQRIAGDDPQAGGRGDVPATGAAPRRRPGPLATLGTLAIAVAAGALFAWLRSPLPWMIGPLVVCAAVNIATGRLHSPRTLRKAGQCVIGITLGLYFSADVMAQLARLSGWIVVGVAWAIVLGYGLARLMQRLTGSNWPTGFFSAAIGGAAEMVILAEREGGKGASVAAAHSVRIMIVVVTIPFLYRALDLHGADPYQPVGDGVHVGGLAALTALAAAGAALLARFSSANAWTIGPLLVAGLLTASGTHWSAVPPWMSVAGQLAIGMALGTRFTPDFLHGALRAVIASAIVTFVAIAACAAFGALLGWAAGIPAATMILATAPGGIAEMSLTARNLELGVPVVTAFQVARMAIVVLTIGAVYRLTGRGSAPAAGRGPGRGDER